ncbi:ROK family transcriptional regulator [Vallitalea guaymasensis]|uniref:ROK family transcriptional regulator n=1 Tax=Vallitalea guaymasensis TaxID=1185412 RepID=UPI00187D2242|nr:ROK family transcriptional regulator [Vallitalea guaymasensis]
MFKIEKKGKSQMKSINKIKIFKMILKDGPISRTDIEKTLKLSAPSVSRIVESLIKEDLVMEVGKEDTYVGRKPISLIVNKNASYIIGINISKSSIYICITNLKSEIIYKDTLSIVAINNADVLLEELDKLITASINNAQISKDKLLGIGVASRGILDYKSGTILKLKKGIEDVDIKRFLEERYNCVIMVENNTNTDLIGEYLINNKLSNNKKSLIYIYLGEGVGGSIICNNQLVRGKNNLAGKIGHMIIQPDGEECYCGKKGHLEAYCSKGAIEKAYRDKKDDKNASLTDICKMANVKDEICVDIINNALNKIAIAVSNLLVVINPDVVVLSGEIFDYYEDALSILKNLVKDLAFDIKLNDIDWVIRSKEKMMIEYSATALIMDKVFNV